MLRSISLSFLVFYQLFATAQYCADCAVSPPQLAKPESVGVVTLLQYSTNVFENICHTQYADPEWQVVGDALIIGPNDQDSVVIQSTGNYDLIFNYMDSDGMPGSCAIENGCNVAENPALDLECGIDIILVLDESNSITPDEEEEVRIAVRGFLDALSETGSRVSIIEFGTRATAEILPGCHDSTSPNYTEVTPASIQSCFEVYLATDYGYTNSGGTNWNDALIKIQDVIDENVIQPDLVLFFTDGNPTFYMDELGNVSGNGEYITSIGLNSSMRAANRIKENTHIFALGVGSNVEPDKLKLISGIRTSEQNFHESDFFISPNFASLSEQLKNFAISSCESLPETAPQLPVILIDDHCFEVQQGEDIAINVLESNTELGNTTHYIASIPSPPSNGHVTIINKETGIHYTADPGFCGRESLSVLVCFAEGSGCDTVDICIDISCECFIPNVITPNGDGLNDFFTVNCLDDRSRAEVVIFNRWGNEVFRSEDYDNTWNGFYRNQPLPEGTYFYSITIANEQGMQVSKAGDVTILAR